MKQILLLLLLLLTITRRLSFRRYRWRYVVCGCRAGLAGWMAWHVDLLDASIRMPLRKRTTTENVHGVTADPFWRITDSSVYYSSKRNGWLGSRVVSVLDSGAEGPGFKSQPRRCRVTDLGKLLTPIVPLFTEQQNWLQPS